MVCPWRAVSLTQSGFMDLTKERAICHRGPGLGTEFPDT